MANDLTDGFIPIAREFIKLVTGKLQPHTSEKITVLIDSDSKVSFFTPSHIQFAKYGRGPGKMPPVKDIEKFVNKKGIIFPDLTGEGTAWAIAKSIAKKGTKNWKPNAPNALEEALEAGMRRYQAELAEFTQKRTLEELQLIYDEIFPEEISL